VIRKREQNWIDRWHEHHSKNSSRPYRQRKQRWTVADLRWWKAASYATSPKTPSFDESVVDERLRTVKQSEKDKNTPEYDQGPPVNILDHLFLGSAAHAGQLELLKRLGITALLNVSPNCPNHWPDKFVYETIPVEDNSTADIKAHFHKAKNSSIRSKLTIY